MEPVTALGAVDARFFAVIGNGVSVGVVLEPDPAPRNDWLQLSKTMIEKLLIAVAGNLCWMAERCFIGDDEGRARAAFGLGFMLVGLGYWLLLAVVLGLLFAFGFVAGCYWRAHFPI